jgi:hypothetical protein
MEISIAEAGYIAGLFDGNGCVTYKRQMKKRGDKKAYPTWNIRMEISMTDKFVIQWVHETLGVGTFAKKPPGKGQLGKKMQYRWRCGFRDALYVSKLLWSEAKVKLHKIEQIIDHYEPRAQELGDNIVDLETEREIRKI